ncbi:MAG: ArsA family ATPase, partial [Mobilitalea sp.]
MGRIIIFTGKGGVGKTTVAAAHARKAAAEGIKTLIVSTDMAHNLADLFEISLGKEEIEVADRLFALEIDPNYVMEHDFADMMNSFSRMFLELKDKESSAQELIMFPGIEELFSLLKIQEIYETNRYDLIIVDCAPTGETLSLLKIPELLSWYMEKFFPVGRVAVRLLAPASKQFFKVELPDKEAMNDIERLYIKLFGLQGLIKNKEISSVRLVTIPEKMVVEETKRNYMYMSLYNFNVDGVYINRILPTDVNNEFFDEWLMIQERYIKEIEDIFGNIPIYKIPWYDMDVNGLMALDQICNDALDYNDLFEVKQIVQNEIYEKTKDGYNLKVFLPCITKEELLIHQSGTDVIIKIGNFKRNIPIPGALRSYAIASAKMEEQTLN